MFTPEQARTLRRLGAEVGCEGLPPGLVLRVASLCRPEFPVYFDAARYHDTIAVVAATQTAMVFGQMDPDGHCSAVARPLSRVRAISTADGAWDQDPQHLMANGWLGWRWEVEFEGGGGAFLPLHRDDDATVSAETWDRANRIVTSIFTEWDLLTN